ncbi:MAG: alpha/beta hydrolase, partial [Bacteroidota bacterium]
MVGHSYGGRVVLRAALSRPDLTLSVTAVEPMMFHFLEDAGHPAFADEQASSAIWAEALRAGDADAAGRAFTALWGNGQPWEAVPERQRAMMAAAMP